MSLTELAIKRPLLITVVFLTLIIFGVLSYTKLNYNLLPKFDANVVTVITTYRGASAAEVENTVTKEIEEAVSSIEGISRISSQSMENASVVLIELKNGFDVTNALNDAQRKVDLIRSKLPDGIDDPTLNKFSTDELPVLRMGVRSNLSAKELYDLIDLQIKPQIANVAGVGQVNILGGTQRQINVQLDAAKLQAARLNAMQVAQLVNYAGLSTPAGDVENKLGKFSIQYDTKFQSVQTLGNIILAVLPDGSKVRLKDVASIEDSQEDLQNLSHVNGIPALSINVIKQTDANAVEVSKQVKARMQLMEQQFKDQNLKFEIASDQSVYTLASANAVIFDLFLAIVIVAAVMLLFLHSFRSSTFVLVALPASMIPTFIMMYVFGMSLNLMTLMALSLVVGILVDDSIVILENIYRHMEMGKDRVKATIEGRKEIGFTAIAITLVDVVVFVPLSLSGGIIGNILREFALVVVFSTLMSLLVCFTLTPLLASRFGRIEHLSNKTLWGRINNGFEAIITSMRNGYENILRWLLAKKRRIAGMLLGTLAMLILSFGLFPGGFIGFAFMSKADRGEISLKIELPTTATLRETNMMVQQAERMVMKHPEVKTVFSNVGYSSASAVASSSNANIAEVNITMVDKHERSISDEEFGVKLQQELAQIPGIKVTAAQISIVGNSEPDISLALKAGNRDDLRKAASDIYDIFKNTPGTKNVDYSIKAPKPQINIQLNYDKLAEFGLNAYEVGYTVASNFSGNDQSKFKANGNEYNIMVNADPYDRSTIDDVRKLSFANSDGQTFTLDQFANVEEIMGETVLERMDRLPSIKINSAVVGRAVGTVSAEITEKINKLGLPQGVTWQYVGQVERQQDSFGSLGLALGIGILLVYLIMVALYENAIYPFVVLMALPLATIGAFLALALTMESLTIFSIIGVIMLMGLVAKNGILLVDFANDARENGMSAVEALIEAGKERFRPILMTTIAMIVGMLPIALASGSGAEVKNGMAWVIIGGLTSSLLLTLVVVPSTYMVVAKAEALINRKKRRNEEEALAHEHAGQLPR